MKQIPPIKSIQEYETNACHAYVIDDLNDQIKNRVAKLWEVKGDAIGEIQGELRGFKYALDLLTGLQAIRAQRDKLTGENEDVKGDSRR